MTTGLEQIIVRFESRAKELGLKPTTACRLAGKPDAIRNIKKAIKAGKKSGVTSTTIDALARVLKVNPAWLMTGAGAMEPVASGREKSSLWVDSSELLKIPNASADEWLWTLVEASYLNLGLDRDEAFALLKSVRAAFEDPHVHPGGLDEARRELLRRLLKSKAL